MIVTAKRQLTVALENEPGRLAEISQILSEAGQSIHGLCVIDNIDKGLVRIIVSDPDPCHELLNERGYFAVESEVLALSVRNIRGIFAKVTRALADRRINIDYAYVTAAEHTENSLLIMKVSDIGEAERSLRDLVLTDSDSPAI